MTLFVAFLRGINVGGRTVKKEVLQQVFTSLEFQNVATYKQSGNVIFKANSDNVDELRKKIEEKLRTKLCYDVTALLRTMKQLKAILEKNTFDGQNPEGTSFLVTFLPIKIDFPVELPTTISKSTAQIIAANGSEVFSVTHGGGEGALPNPFIESKLKLKATTRNLNILREIVEKFSV